MDCWWESYAEEASDDEAEGIYDDAETWPPHDLAWVWEGGVKVLFHNETGVTLRDVSSRLQKVWEELGDVLRHPTLADLINASFVVYMTYGGAASEPFDNPEWHGLPGKRVWSWTDDSGSEWSDGGDGAFDNDDDA